MSKPYWVSGPPGTGKTRIYIKNLYKEYLDKGVMWNRIVILSHTVNAAREILKAIKELPQLENIPEDVLEEQICTIHAYFKAESKKKNRKKYSKEDHNKFCSDNPGMKKWIHHGKRSWDKHPLYAFVSQKHGKQCSSREMWLIHQDTYKKELGRDLKLENLNEWEKKYHDYREHNKKVSFEDMLDAFIDESTKVPDDIEVLIVDEGQDCNKPQVQALLKAGLNVPERNFIFVGDRDQEIYNYSGSHTQFFIELEKNYLLDNLSIGKRCGKTINTICKNIINPQRKRLGLPEKKWTPAANVIGNHYWIPDIERPNKNLDILLDKIFNTKETFLFTYRGNPTDRHINEFLQKYGVDYRIVSSHSHGKETDYVSRDILRCFNTWDNFYEDIVTLDQIKEYWPYLPSKTFKVHGKGNVTKAFNDVINGSYNIKQLYEMGLVVEEALKQKSFIQSIKKSERQKFEPKVPYIKKVLKNHGVEKRPRVEHDNIHKVKGLTYDNIIVELSNYRMIERDESERLVYTGYSRGRTDCWSIASRVFKDTNRESSLGGVQHDRERIFSLPSSRGEEKLEKFIRGLDREVWGEHSYFYEKEEKDDEQRNV